MLHDARSLPAGQTIEADICIIGAGAAGIAMAREFIGSPIRVALIESGGLEPEEATQALYRGEVVGQKYDPLDVPRLRYFGGTTNHWAGWCRPLDPVDFEPRPGVLHTGWPLTRAELDPFYERAQKLCQLGAYVYDDIAFYGREAGLTPLPLPTERLRSSVIQVSPPTRFGEVYRRDLEAAGNIAVYLNANLLSFETSANAAEVRLARLACLNGPSLAAKARHYVLATGGIENARLLLLSNQTQAAGLGNGNDLVGRFFMDHPWIYRAGYVLFSEPQGSLPFYLNETAVAGGRVFAALTPSPDWIVERGIGNFRIVMRSTPRPIAGTESALEIYQALRSGELPDELGYHLGNILGEIDVVADAFYRRLTGKDGSPFWSPDKTRPVRSAIVDINLEHLPNPESRVRLGAQRDALGQYQAALDWQPRRSELDTLRSAIDLLAVELGASNMGRLRVDMRDGGDGWPDSMTASRHHIGTTRMAVDPSRGVVDTDCRVHGIANLHVAGSSVFPTSGFTNPTLTIVALALRLSDRLRKLLS